MYVVPLSTRTANNLVFGTGESIQRLSTKLQITTLLCFWVAQAGLELSTSCLSLTAYWNYMHEPSHPAQYS